MYEPESGDSTGSYVSIKRKPQNEIVYLCMKNGHFGLVSYITKRSSIGTTRRTILVIQFLDVAA